MFPFCDPELIVMVITLVRVVTERSFANDTWDELLLVEPVPRVKLNTVGETVPVPPSVNGKLPGVARLWEVWVPISPVLFVSPAELVRRKFGPGEGVWKTSVASILRVWGTDVAEAMIVPPLSDRVSWVVLLSVLTSRPERVKLVKLGPPKVPDAGRRKVVSPEVALKICGFRGLLSSVILTWIVARLVVADPRTARAARVRYTSPRAIFLDEVIKAGALQYEFRVGSPSVQGIPSCLRRAGYF